MSAQASFPFAVLQPPYPPDRPLQAIGVGIRLTSAQTGGQLAVIEYSFPPGCLVPPHMHTREDEFTTVIQGRVGFRSGDHEVVLETGGYITKPRGVLHTMWNPGPEPARAIELITPGNGFERFYGDVADLVAADAGRDALVETASAYGISFDGRWVPELVGRYGLTAPPGH